jgi:hypothetical protein
MRAAGAALRAPPAARPPAPIRPQHAALPAADESYAAQGFPVYGPNGWVQYRTKEGEPYFHNHNTNLTQWERPADWPVNA